MATGKEIKIIKRAERVEAQAALSEKRKAGVGNSGDKTKQDAVAIVTEWVRELRQKKVAETALGFESLFRKAA